MEYFTLEDRKRNFTNSAIFSCVSKASCLALEETSSILGLFFMVAWHFELREAAGKKNVKVQFCSRLSFKSWLSLTHQSKNVSHLANLCHEKETTQA